MPAQTSIQSTTQQFLDIYDITNDLLIMKDGATALIITVNAINFGLFAEQEQDAVIYSYASLLNSLNYPIQIVVKSQTKDVTNYLQLLKEQEDQTADPTQRERIKRYRMFVADLIREGNVLDKKFYVAIPATALEMGLMPPSTVIPGVKKVDISSVDRSIILEKARNILEPKRDHLIGQFGRIGLQARQLATQEIIQLFYTSYNPEAAEGQQITDTRSYTTTVVNAQIQRQPSPVSVPTTGGTLPMTDQTIPQPMAAPLAPTPIPAEPVATPELAVANAPITPSPEMAAPTPVADPGAQPPQPSSEVPPVFSAPPAPVFDPQAQINSVVQELTPPPTAPIPTATPAPTQLPEI